MNFTNPLDPVYKAFDVLNDCFRLAARTIQIQHKELIQRTRFADETAEETYIALEAAAKQAGDLVILALFATFERFVIEHLQTSNRLLAVGYPTLYSSRLAEKFESEVEYWKFGEILDLFKGEVDPDLIGRVKQIKQYRDWIAHQNPGKSVPTHISPKIAFDVLTQMIEQIRVTHTLPSKESEDALDTLEFA